MTEQKAETETFEIRSKSFTIKWINIPQNSNIKWKIRPLKNSINLGIYQQTQYNDSSHETPSTSNLENLNLDQVNELPHRFFNNMSNKNKFEDSLTRSSSQSIHSMGHSINNSLSSINNINSSSISLEEKLDKQLTKIQWIGKCNGDSLKNGSIKTSKGGLYAFVFDNTFSKTKAKTVLFQFDIENLEDYLKMNNEINSNKINDNDVDVDVDNYLKTQFKSNLNGSSAKIINFKGVQYLEGFLMKKKRRNNSAKNFTKRFFSLNLTYSILYYYSDSDSNIIRGNMMITQTVVSADSLELLLYLDSGMEQWILKATNKKDFDIWVSAFNFVKNQCKKLKGSSIKSPSLSLSRNNTINFNENNSNFSDDLNEINNNLNPQYHTVHDKISSLKDLINSYIQSNNDTEENNYNITTPSIQQGEFAKQLYAEPQTPSGDILVPSSSSLSLSIQPNVLTPNGSIKNVRRSSKSSIVEPANTNNNHNNNNNNNNSSMPSRKPSFLRRLKKKGSQSLPSTPDTQNFDIETSQPSISTNKNRSILTESYFPANTDHSQSQSLSSVPCSPVIESLSNSLITNKKISDQILNSILEKVNDLENEYLELLKQQKVGFNTESRISLGYTKSILSQEFYDAQEFADETEQGVVMLNEYESNGVINTAKEIKDDELSSEIFGNQLKETKTVISSSSSSSIKSDQEVENMEDMNHLTKIETNESKMIDLYPLPYHEKYHFRSDIKPAACEPPSLISILRKGIGKDLTSMTMPISTNEPLSFLQKYTESLEYCSLVNDAMNSPIETGERILKISTFAISFLSSYSDKIRSLRKPFNPLLGETFELVRPDLDIRVLTEKVIHKPFVMAAHVDSTNWYIEHSICPQQKFYGKTAEISVDGTLKLKFRNNDEVYEWNQPNTILRNIVSLTGEKYTEPIDSITIKSNTGYKCIVNFISENGRFTSSRSEKVELKVYRDKNDKIPLALSAKGSWTKDISMSNGKLIWKISEHLTHHEKKYGFTKFSCCLNDLDEIHKLCAPSDSRRRPDQRMYENGIVDKADELKLKLEENQRLRRKDANGNEVIHKPAFFEKGSTDLDWAFIHGEKGYWNRRKTGDWDDLMKLW